MSIVSGISVIICCYNSAKRLPETIKHLAKQQVPDSIPWEVIVVDNASTDDTSITASLEWNKYENRTDTSFSIVKEKMSGLTNARICGIMKSQYSYCLFCDDDNWLEEDYVHTAYVGISSDPKIGVIGGHGMPVFETNPPVWFEEVEESYAVGPQAPQAGDVTKERGYVFGAGAIFRRSVILDLLNSNSGFLLTDRTGSAVTSGGDEELCLNYVLRGYEIHYTNELKFRHFIAASKLTEQYHNQLKYSFIKSRIVLSLYRYKIQGKEDILNRNFLWLRELVYSLKNDLLKRPFSLTDFISSYTVALIKNYNSYHRTLNYLKQY